MGQVGSFQGLGTTLSDGQDHRRPPLRWIAAGALILWTAAILVLSLETLRQERRHIEKSALSHALALMEKDLLYRRWNAQQGGVYAPVSENLPPNPYLNVPERDIETPFGKKLTLVNPAYMTRMVHDLARKSGVSSSHLTSLNPTHPANAPNAWETKALKWLENHPDKRHFYETVEESGTPLVKVMMPLVLEDACRRCHNTPWDVPGALRGGISTVVPLSVFAEAHRESLSAVLGRHALIWFLGVLGIGWASFTAYARVRERESLLAKTQRQERFWKSVLENLQDPMVVLDRDLNIVVLNASAASLAETEPDQAVGRSCKDVFSKWHALSGACAFEKCPAQQVLTTGVSCSRRMEIQLADETTRVFHVVVSPLKNNGEKISGVIESFRDITNEARAQERLAKQHREMELLFDHMHGAFALHEILTDASGVPVDYRFLKVNPAFEALTGWKAHDVVGKTLQQILPQGAQEWVQRYGRTALYGERVEFIADEPTLQKTFSVRAYQTEPGRFVTLFFDVTEREKLQEQLRHAQKMQAVGQLAGGVAHEFNNILQVINGYVEMLLAETPAEDPRREHLQRVMHGGLRAARLVQQLLAFSRKKALQPEVTDMNELLRDFAKLVQKLVGETITVRCVLGHGLWPVMVDRQLMEQVLMNLVVNARDAMPSGGEIVLETANVHLHEDHVRPHAHLKPGPYVMVSVADTGLGMTADVLERIFEPFFTTKEVGKGSGLGLAVVYGIVKQHDGVLDVSSEPGKGTVVKIYLPPHEGKPSESEEQTESLAEEALRGTETVLLAEDDPAVRSYLATVLREAGYRVLEAQDGMEAVEVFATSEEPIDLVVTDVSMPRMGGQEAVGLLRQRGWKIPAIFISGYVKRPEECADNPKGLNLFIDKPVRRRVLLQAIRSLLAR
ncbi:PAS domain-containing protein [Desulfosoma caldarium]|uniref:histidine kinase n=1 Tax=Desulfosoma caldarium TaxID=610254 RepID=A0A3N1VP45_9BACT|nr:PAS domain-containing protein [Desulfosoma caldarium]ROR01687.1 PAS domain S-box-containing protein [Desulfosoma caldarium]